MSIEYIDLIGCGFEYGAKGPDKYDCYHLVRELKRREGVDIPDYESPDDQRAIEAIFKREIRLWREVEQGNHDWFLAIPRGREKAVEKHYYRKGSVAMFNIQGMGTHVGYVVGLNKFIHVWEGSQTVIIERLDEWQHRLIGFYEYVGD